jgi:hypothetical protein
MLIVSLDATEDAHVAKIILTLSGAKMRSCRYLHESIFTSLATRTIMSYSQLMCRRIRRKCTPARVLWESSLCSQGVCLTMLTNRAIFSDASKAIYFLRLMFNFAKVIHPTYRDALANLSPDAKVKVDVLRSKVREFNRSSRSGSSRTRKQSHGTGGQGGPSGGDPVPQQEVLAAGYILADDILLPSSVYNVSPFLLMLYVFSSSDPYLPILLKREHVLVVIDNKSLENMIVKRTRRGGRELTMLHYLRNARSITGIRDHTIPIKQELSCGKNDVLMVMSYYTPLRELERLSRPQFFKLCHQLVEVWIVSGEPSICLRRFSPALFLSPILQALTFMHEHGVVRRNFNIDNIVYSPTQLEIFVIDLGQSEREMGICRGFLWDERMGSARGFAESQVRSNSR